MSKVKIIDEESEISVLQERLFLSKIKNPFIVNMYCSFQDKNNLYLVLELLTGGDLRYHLTNYIYSFTETQIKFFLTNIILALQYIHSKGILHRDIKPENILFDNKGYAYLTDFGIAWDMDEDNEGDNSGTPSYMAPETIFGLKQDYVTDFYSVGVIGYELLMGERPYDGNSRKEIRKQMNEEDVLLKMDCEYYSDLCIEFINGLLNKNPDLRLGAESGISQLKDSNFFRGINWELIYKHKYISPIVDIIKFSKERIHVNELFDNDYCNRKDTVTESTLGRYINILNDREYGKAFKNFSFINVDNIVDILPQKEKKLKIIKKVTVSSGSNSNDISSQNDEYKVKIGMEKTKSIEVEKTKSKSIRENEVYEDNKKNKKTTEDKKESFKKKNKKVYKSVGEIVFPSIHNKTQNKKENYEEIIDDEYIDDGYNARPNENLYYNNRQDPIYVNSQNNPYNINNIYDNNQMKSSNNNNGNYKIKLKLPYIKQRYNPVIKDSNYEYDNELFYEHKLKKYKKILMKLGIVELGHGLNGYKFLCKNVVRQKPKKKYIILKSKKNLYRNNPLNYRNFDQQNYCNRLYRNPSSFFHRNNYNDFEDSRTGFFNGFDLRPPYIPYNFNFPGMNYNYNLYNQDLEERERYRNRERKRYNDRYMTRRNSYSSCSYSNDRRHGRNRHRRSNRRNSYSSYSCTYSKHRGSSRSRNRSYDRKDSNKKHKRKKTETKSSDESSESEKSTKKDKKSKENDSETTKKLSKKNKNEKKKKDKKKKKEEEEEEQNEENEEGGEENEEGEENEGEENEGGEEGEENEGGEEGEENEGGEEEGGEEEGGEEEGGEEGGEENEDGGEENEGEEGGEENEGGEEDEEEEGKKKKKKKK